MRLLLEWRADTGRVVAMVGVAPVRPAEFVIIRIGQWTADREP